MDKPPIKLKDIHSAILMRVFALGGVKVPLARLSDEVAGRRSAAQISGAVSDLVAAKLAIVEAVGESRLMTLEASGRRNARMMLDCIALTDAGLIKPITTFGQFIAYFERGAHGLGKSPSRWQLWVLGWKWLFRRNWDGLGS